MKYQIHEIAELAGISVRTLHYYDEIGLLVPSLNLENGYRIYEDKELIRLQQILFFRELDFPLIEIKAILDNPNFDLEKTLMDQKNLIKLKKERLEKLMDNIDRTLNMNIKKDKMKDGELFEGFDETTINEYKAEAKERWGGTEAHKQSEIRTKNWSKADFDRVKLEWEEIAQDYGLNMGKGFKSDEIQAVVLRHFNQINKFYNCNNKMFLCLADMYVDDPRFAANYEKYNKKLPEFVRSAIKYFCESRTIPPM